jgi:hypothetical protein
MIGETFGGRTVIGYGRVDAKGRQYYTCKCVCGHINDVLGRYLLKGFAHYCQQCYLKRRYPTNREVGKKYNDLTILEYTGSEKRKQVHEAICICGTKIKALSCDIKSGKRKQCSIRCPRLIGKKFGEWTILALIDVPQKKPNFRFYECMCSCGKKQNVRSVNLLNNRSSKCRSCANKENFKKRWKK